MQNSDLIRYFISMWNSSEIVFPEYGKIYSSHEKREREIQFDTYERKFRESKVQGGKALKNKVSPESFFPKLRTFLQNIFDYRGDQLDIILSKEFTDATRKFFSDARSFDRELKPEDVYQACRNVWIMNGIQLMQGRNVELTPAITGYSLIYPYSDNYLDNPAVTINEKADFSARFRRRLEGESVSPGNSVERQIFRLVEMIESQFERVDFPGVYNSLYSIHDAQTRSLDLFGKSMQLTDDEVVEISFWKGGASVLADGYLVSGVLTREEERALFGYGIYLQVLDDIQDIAEDTEAGMRTLFSAVNRKEPADFLVNKSIHFGRNALGEMSCFDFQQAAPFFSMMQKSLETMIIESIGTNDSNYSAPFRRNMEKYSPLSYSYLRKKRKQSKTSRFGFFRQVFSSTDDMI